MRITITDPGSLMPVLVDREIDEKLAKGIIAMLEYDDVVDDVEAVLDGDAPPSGAEGRSILLAVPDLTNAECGEIAITAAEGGIGYWSVIERYEYKRWHTEASDFLHVRDDLPDDFVFYTIEYENPNDEYPPRLTADITPDLLRRGLTVAIAKYPHMLRDVFSLSREDWTGEIDSDIADNIVQCGVFGEVVFG